MRRTHKRVLTGVGIVVVGLGSLYAISLVRAQARLRRAYAALEADGRPMLAAEVMPPAIPDADNAAPLFMAAARPLKENATRIRNLLDRLNSLSSRFMGGTIDQEDLEEFTTYMGQDRVKSALGYFEEGLQRPGCRFSRDYDQGLFTDLHEARDIRSLFRIRMAKNRLDAPDDTVPASWDSVFEVFHLVEALRLEPVWWSQVTRYSMARMGCNLIQRLCVTHPPDAQVYLRLQSLLTDMDDVSPLILGLDGKRLLKGESVFSLPMDQLYEALLQNEFMGASRGVFFRMLFAFIKFKPRLVADHAGYLEAMLKSVHVMQAPYDPNMREALRDLAGRSMLTRELMPYVGFGQRWHCGMAASARITRAGLALMQYRQVHGVYPAELDALGLAGVVDPFSGKPLHYRAEGEAFFIYSVGENQQDNQGRERDRDHKECDDIAWHVPPLSIRASVTDQNEVLHDH